MKECMSWKVSLYFQKDSNFEVSTTKFKILNDRFHFFWIILIQKVTEHNICSVLKDNRRGGG